MPFKRDGSPINTVGGIRFSQACSGLSLDQLYKQVRARLKFLHYDSIN